MKSTLIRTIGVVTAAGLMFLGTAFAQTANPASEAGPGKFTPGHPRVNQVNHRQAKQQARIANGIHNGSINPNEARRLERGQARINRQEKHYLAKNNGHLTKPEQRQLNREQNVQNKRIYHAKHNGR